jgi:vacuolar-type H+-ATPase subunit I/STV1
MKRIPNFILWLVFIVFLGACTRTLPPPLDRTSISPPGIVSPLKEETVIEKTDSALFNEGIFYLGGPGRVADYTKARSAFDVLLKMHPESKWRSLSEVLLRLIDEMQLCQAKNVSDRMLIEKADADRGKLSEENEQLKKEIRLLDDKFQAEMTKLHQENEQLKKDIQLLKNLEIQLDKREKMLR